MRKFIISFLSAFILTLLFAVPVLADNIAIEAEDFTINSNFAVRSDSAASGGKYIASIASKWNAPDSITNESYFTEIEAEYKFNIATEANYVIWARVANPTAYNNDSFWAAIDGVVYGVHFGSDDLGFRWKKIVTTKFTPGEHKFRIYNREPAARIDKIIITSNILYMPSGVGELPANEFYDESDLPTPIPEEKPPANEHPRLLVRKSDLPTVRQNLNHSQNAAVYAKVKNLAESTRNGDQATYDADLLEIMQSKAFMYMINGDEEKGRQAVNIVMNHTRKFSMGTRTPDTTTMRLAGHVIFTTACVYDWCYDLFTPEQRLEYIERCEEIATKYFEGGYPIVEEAGAQGSQGHNDENPLFKDLLAFGIAVYDEKPFVYNDIAGVLYSNYFPWREDLYPSGWNHQGVSTYGVFRNYYEAICAYMLGVIGQKPLPDSLNEYVYKYVYFRRPDGGYVMDADETRKKFDNTFHENNNGLYFIVGNMYKDTFIKRLYFHDMPGNARSTSYLTGVNAPMYLLMNDVSVGTDNSLSLPLTRYFGSPIGAMIARTDWNEGADANTAIAVMKPFENYFGGHMHREAGSFELYYKGMLALDAGAYEAPAYTKDDGTKVQGSHWGTAHYGTYLSAPIAHNVLAVFDDSNQTAAQVSLAGQRLEFGSPSSLKTFEEYKNGSNKTGENIAYDFGPDKNTPEYSYIEGDLTAAYKTDIMTDYTRSYMFLNLFDDKIPAALIVYDRVETKNGNLRKSFLLHSQEEPTVSGNTVTISRTEGHNNGRLTDTVLLPQNAELEKVGGEGKEYLVGSTNYEIYRQPTGDESGSWRMEINAPKGNTKDYFLNVMQVSDDDDSIEPLSVKSDEQGDFIGVFIADRAVFMKKDRGTVKKEFTVTADGGGDISFIITNLAGGNWSVKTQGGTQIYTQDISSGNGVLRFRATAGTYTVSFSEKSNVEPKKFSLKGDAAKKDYQAVSVYFDNNYNGRAIFRDGTLMVALEDMAKHTGSAYKIQGDAFTAYGSNGVLSGTVGKSDVTVNGKAETLEGTPVSIDGTLYLPITYLATAYDFSYEYDELAYVLQMECTPKAVVVSDGIGVKNIGWFDASGNALTKLTPGATVTLKAKLSRRFGAGDGAVSATLYGAVYDGEDMLCIETDTQKFTAYGDTQDFEVTLKIPSDAESVSPKILIWRADSLEPCVLSTGSPTVTGICVGGTNLKDFDEDKLTYTVRIPDYIDDPYIVCYTDGLGISASAEYDNGKVFLTLAKNGVGREYTINLTKKLIPSVKVMFTPSVSENEKTELTETYVMKKPDARLSDTSKTLAGALGGDLDNFGSLASRAYHNRSYIYYDGVPDELVGLTYFPTDFDLHRFDSRNAVTVTSNCDIRIYFSSRSSVVNDGATAVNLSEPLTMKRLMNSQTAIKDAASHTFSDTLYYYDLIVPNGEEEASVTLNTAHQDFIPLQLMYKYIE